jgi:hypothetical protein
MMLKNSFLCCCFSLFAAVSFAQNKSMEETLTYINGKLTGKYQIDVKRGLLLLTSYKDNMNMMDETILITDLKPEVIYSEEEKAIIIKCTDGDKCIERKEYLVEKKNYFSRLKIVTPEDEKSVKGLQKAFLHLLRSVHEPKYKSTESFE